MTNICKEQLIEFLEREIEYWGKDQGAEPTPEHMISCQGKHDAFTEVLYWIEKNRFEI